MSQEVTLTVAKTSQLVTPPHQPHSSLQYDHLVTSSHLLAPFGHIASSSDEEPLRHDPQDPVFAQQSTGSVAEAQTSGVGVHSSDLTSHLFYQGGEGLISAALSLPEDQLQLQRQHQQLYLEGVGASSSTATTATTTSATVSQGALSSSIDFDSLVASSGVGGLLDTVGGGLPYTDIALLPTTNLGAGEFSSTITSSLSDTFRDSSSVGLDLGSISGLSSAALQSTSSLPITTTCAIDSTLQLKVSASSGQASTPATSSKSEQPLGNSGQREMLRDGDGDLLCAGSGVGMSSGGEGRGGAATGGGGGSGVVVLAQRYSWVEPSGRPTSPPPEFNPRLHGHQVVEVRILLN